MMINKGFLVVLALLLIAIPFTSSADFDHVITNSENWMDVYSGIHYANLEEIPSDFLTSQNHARILVDSLPKANDILVVSSKDKPFTFNYADTLDSAGFNSAEEIVSRNLNFELIKNLENIKNFVVVGDSYGYPAMAVVPYAKETDSWVFFANKYNVDEIDFILSSRNVEDVLIYGYVDREVRDTLEKYSPSVINNQDKFDDNIEIVQNYLKLNPTTQVLLTNGDFIEKELMGGTQPILFTGRENVPDQIRDYLKNSELEIGVLIGNELMGAATNIRRSAGISVMVKFARGARTPGDGVSAVEGLDLFPLPSPLLNLEIYSVEYNKLTSQLEITYKSVSNIPVYFKGTITIRDGLERSTVGDTTAIFISPSGYKTVSYAIELGSYEDLKAEIFTVYGESKSSLDRTIDMSIDINVVEIIDSCEIEVKSVSYNKQNGEFRVKIKNTADVTCWVDASFENILVGYEEKTISTDSAEKIERGDSKILIIQEILLDSDLEKNNFVDLVVHFGQKETTLVKILKGRFEVNVISFSIVTYLIVISAIGAFIFFFLFLRRRKEEKEEKEFKF